MANPNADFRMLPLEGCIVDPYVKRKAINNLRALHSAGELHPLPGWEGEVVDGYMDLLGLNDRPIRVNRSTGMKR